MLKLRNSSLLAQNRRDNLVKAHSADSVPAQLICSLLAGQCGSRAPGGGGNGIPQAVGPIAGRLSLVTLTPRWTVRHDCHDPVLRCVLEASLHLAADRPSSGP